MGERPARTAPTITSPVHQTAIRTDAVTIAGTGEAGAEIALFDWQQPVGRTMADQRGRWSIGLTALMPGDHVYIARAVDPESGALSPISNLCTIEVDPPASSPETQGIRSARGARRTFLRAGSQLAAMLRHRERAQVPAREAAAADAQPDSAAAASQTTPAEAEPDVRRAMQQEEVIDPIASPETRPAHGLDDGVEAAVMPAEPVRHRDAPSELELAALADRGTVRVAATPIEERGKQRANFRLHETAEAEMIAAEPIAAEIIPVEVVAARVDEFDDVEAP